MYVFDFCYIIIIFNSTYISTTLYSCTFGKGRVGSGCLYFYWYECALVVSACESLHVCTVSIWHCEHARFCVEVLNALYINIHSFIHSEVKSAI